jgi:hypothetical protein
MQITITIADKVIKSAIDNALDGSVYDYFDSATLKAAKIPKPAVAIKAIMADAKFQAELARRLTIEAESALEDVIYDEMYEIKLPGLDAMLKACEAAYEARESLQQEQKEAAEVARMVKTLEKAGFKIVKA